MTGDTVVGVVGLGDMGAAGAVRLARTGPVTAFDPDPARCDEAARKDSARALETLRED
jgi:3-hydroxyisobutyrate dehydrogenase-like beta-hydroxyacid dehydrogenase